MQECVKNNITEEEKVAIKIYGGFGEGTIENHPFSKYRGIYSVINSIFFEGIDTEFTRVFDDGKYLEPNVIKENSSDELLNIILNLYSAMYKYSKTNNTKFDKLYRVERTQSMEKMLKNKMTISNTSTSMANLERISRYTSFQKRDMSYLEICVEPGTPCVDFCEVLGKEEYRYYTESEVLIAPFCPVEISKSNSEYYGLKKGEENKIFKVIVSPPEKSKPLTKEEEKNKENVWSIFKRKSLRDNAYSVLKKLSLTTEQGLSREEVEELITDKEKEKYIKWKSAFLQLIKYRFREISLEIENQMKQYKTEEIVELTEKEMEEINSETVEEMIEFIVLDVEKINDKKEVYK